MRRVAGRLLPVVLIMKILMETTFKIAKLADAAKALARKSFNSLKTPAARSKCKRCIR
jgi:hypothetical protein